MTSRAFQLLSSWHVHVLGSIFVTSSRPFLKIHHTPTAASAPTVINSGAMLFFFSLLKNIRYSLNFKADCDPKSDTRRRICIYFYHIFKKYLLLLTKKRVCCKIKYKSTIFARQSSENVFLWVIIFSCRERNARYIL